MKYFGTDGFRGRANEKLTAIHAFRVGRFLGRYHARGRGEQVRIAVGKDTRRSSYALEYSLAAGAAASGADVYLLHVTTTPSLSYLVRTEGFDSGVMISASHNAFEDNGIKLFADDGEKLSEEVLARIEEYLDGGTLPLATGAEIGRTVDYVCGRNRYLAYLLSIPRVSFRGLRVGLDCANGSAFAIAKAVFDALGAEVKCVGVSPDGTNINAGCGSTHPQQLRALVLGDALDLGFAFDGDADRCICVDEKGEIVDGDGILYLAAKYMRAHGELERDTVVTTVLSNAGLGRALAREGIGVRYTPVGDKYVSEELARGGFALGGEPSGHIVFRKYATTGDGILTALRVAEIMLESKCPLSCLTRGYRPLPRREKNVRTADCGSVAASEGVKAAVGAAERAGVRAVVRASGTEPVVRILVEGEECLLDDAMAAIERAVCASGEVL